MNIPALQGVIERRVLVNYRVDPAVVARLLPPPFEPKLVHGHGLAGICLIRLGSVRPRGCPAWAGVRSENAAHRIAVTWDEGGTPREGVFIPRRDTSSWLNRWAGGRLFPGEHHRASFRIREQRDRYAIDMRSADGVTQVALVAARSPALAPGSVFASLDEASRFFEHGSVGYSATYLPDHFDGIELRALEWRIEPLEVAAVHSSFFEDRARFPEGSAVFDSAFLMRGIAHEWHARPPIVLAA